MVTHPQLWTFISILVMLLLAARGMVYQEVTYLYGLMQ